MKLKYKKCLNTLEDIFKTKVSHNEISKIIKVSANALSNRLSNDGYLKDEEIEKIEQHYKINFSAIDDCVNIEYFLNISDFKNKNSARNIKIPIKCFDNFSNSKNYFILKYAGDTMHPFIKNHDKLLIERHQGEQITDNQIYIFNYENEIFIKRLVKNIDQIVIKSDNEFYPARFLDKAQIGNFSLIGQIIGLIRDV